MAFLQKASNLVTENMERGFYRWVEPCLGPLFARFGPPITTLLCLDINRDFMPNFPSVCNVNREWIHPNPNTRQDCVIVCFTHNNKDWIKLVQHVWLSDIHFITRHNLPLSSLSPSQLLPLAKVLISRQSCQPSEAFRETENQQSRSSHCKQLQ